MKWILHEPFCIHVYISRHTHIHTQRTLSNVLLSTRLLTAQIQHGGKERERERGKEAFGTTSSYASVGRGTTRAVIANTIPTQCPVSCNYIYAICKPIKSRASVVPKNMEMCRTVRHEEIRFSSQILNRKSLQIM